MFKQSYIVISKYLQQSDASDKTLDSADQFEFTFNGKFNFYVYKSLACFLSKEALTNLSQGNKGININISGSFDYNRVKCWMIDLLSGKPIVVDKSNFLILQSIFTALGNIDFDIFFGKIPPENPTNFYLSLNSLKNIPNEFVEKELFEPKALSGFSVPIGLTRLFWSNRYHQNLSRVQSLFTITQMQNGIQLLNQLKNGNYFQIDQEQFEFLDYFRIHSELIRSLFNLNVSIKNDSLPQPIAVYDTDTDQKSSRLKSSRSSKSRNLYQIQIIPIKKFSINSL